MYERKAKSCQASVLDAQKLGLYEQWLALAQLTVHVGYLKSAKELEYGATAHLAIAAAHLRA